MGRKCYTRFDDFFLVLEPIFLTLGNAEQGRGIPRSGRLRAQSKHPEDVSFATQLQGVLFEDARVTMLAHARWPFLQVLGLHLGKPYRRPLRRHDRVLHPSPPSTHVWFDRWLNQDVRR